VLLPWLQESSAPYAVSVSFSALGDTIVSVADLQLARALRASDHVLWVKDWTAPDLGNWKHHQVVGFNFSSELYLPILHSIHAFVAHSQLSFC
jgi:hypothetical protein